MATVYLNNLVILILAVIHSSSCELDLTSDFMAALVSELSGNELSSLLADNIFDNNNNIPKEYRLNTTELVRASGYDCEEFDTTTEDGYILKLFHIIGNELTQDLPILMMHGLLDSSEAFCVRRNISLAINLAESGYDVYLANMRGNKYSRRHKTLDPDVDKEFWDFTFHENGYYDYPALIDAVLQKTGKSQLLLVGHSQGTFNYFVMGSTRPEYNDKIKVCIALGPIFYLQHLRGLAATGPVTFPAAYGALTALGQVEFLSQKSALTRIIQNVCTRFKDASYKLCLYGGLFPILGYDAEQLEPEFVPVIMGQYFAGTSVKLIAHYSQFVYKHFGQFNYGQKENYKIYGSKDAPLYNLKNISTKVVLIVAKNDYLSTVKDSIMLRDALPNVTYYELPYEKFAHNDFLWGNQMKKYLFAYVHEYLNKYK